MNNELFDAELKNIRAYGYKGAGKNFIILKGSFAVDTPELKASFFSETNSYERVRNELISSGKLKKITDKYQFTDDVTFTSPSQAACVIWGANLNGPKEFGIVETSSKNKKNHKLYFELESNRAIEGYKQDKLLNSTSRDRKIVEERKALDNYTCLVCGYRKEIGGKFIIECHHLEPISLGERETTIKDLASLCPTCHRIVHLRQPIYTIAEVKKLIKT